MEQTFKIGDRVRRIKGGTQGGIRVGDIATVTGLDGYSHCYLNGGHHIHSKWNLELVEEYKVTTQSIKTMAKTLTERFKLAMTSEPKKTFIQKGICNADGSFTTEGRELFEQYQLLKLGEEFKKDVVDKLPEEKE